MTKREKKEELEMPMEQLLEQCNCSELVQILRMSGQPAGRAIAIEQLRQMVLTGDRAVGYSTEQLLEDKRVALLFFINKHREYLTLPCHGNCAIHDDVHVLDCYIDNKDQLGGENGE